MDLSKTVACTALILMILLTAGHAFAQSDPEQKHPAKRSGTTAYSAG